MSDLINVTEKFFKPEFIFLDETIILNQNYMYTYQKNEDITNIKAILFTQLLHNILDDLLFDGCADLYDNSIKNIIMPYEHMYNGTFVFKTDSSPVENIVSVGVHRKYEEIICFETIKINYVIFNKPEYYCVIYYGIKDLKYRKYKIFTENSINEYDYKNFKRIQKLKELVD